MSEGGARSSRFRGWILFFCGICMGVADLIPGISGGTVAFIIGFYQQLLESLKTVNGSSIRLLLTGHGKEFARRVEWKFLLTLLSGILCAFICFANLFHFILSHELYRVYLYALFLGLILASFVFCVRQVPVWNLFTVLALCCGAVIAFLLTQSTPANEVFSVPSSFLYVWLFICGSFAICALLLPGISGSYILTVLGVYPLVIEALVDFVNAGATFSFNWEAFAILISLGGGILFGAILFARGVSWLLRIYPSLTLATLSGFMMGALQSVWPFWTYDYLLIPFKLHKGPQLVVLDPYLPSLASPLLWQAAFFALAGFWLVFGLENYVQRKSQRE